MTPGVPAVVQWVKSLTTAAWVTVEAWVSSLALCRGLKDLALLQMWCRLQLWSRNFHMPRVRQKKKKKKKNTDPFYSAPQNVLIKIYR